MFLFIDVFCRSKPTKQQRQTHKASKPTKQQGNMVVQAVAMADVGLVAAHRAIACPVASLRYMHSHEHGKTSNLSPCLFPHSLCFHLVATRYRSDSRPTFNVYKQVGTRTAQARCELRAAFYALRQGALARRRHAASCKFHVRGGRRDVYMSM